MTLNKRANSVKCSHIVIRIHEDLSLKLIQLLADLRKLPRRHGSRKEAIGYGRDPELNQVINVAHLRFLHLALDEDEAD